MEFSALSEDLVIHILMACDIVTIMRFEQTSKYIRTLAGTRQLWLTLIKELDFDHAPALLPHESVQSLSTERLRRIVIESHRGYESWTSSSGVMRSRNIRLDLSEYIRHPERGVAFHILAPGGRYFIIQGDDDFIRCFDTDSKDLVCSYERAGASDEIVKNVDCTIVDNGDSLILAFFAFQISNSEDLVAVIKFDLRRRISNLVSSFAFPPMDQDVFAKIIFISERSRLRIHNDIVVSWRPGTILVGNWRTGAMCLIGEDGDVHSVNIAQNHIFCSIRPLNGGMNYVSAALSRIFPISSESPKADTTRLKSEDIFTHKVSLNIPLIEGNTCLPFMELVSICTRTWEYPDLCEFGAPANLTRILLALRLAVTGDAYQTVFELSFSSTSDDLKSISARTEYTQGSQANDSHFELTCRRQSALFIYDDTFPDFIHFTDATRTGRAIGSYIKVTEPYYAGESISLLEESTITTMMHAINLSEFLENSSPNREGSTDRVESRPKIPLIKDSLGEGDEEAILNLNLEEYSGALWYRQDNSVFIHYFD